MTANEISEEAINGVKWQSMKAWRNINQLMTLSS